MRAAVLMVAVALAPACMDYEVTGAGFDVVYEFEVVAPGAPIPVSTTWATCRDSSYIVGHAEIPTTTCDTHDFTASFRCLGVPCRIMSGTGTGALCGTSDPADPTFVPCAWYSDVVPLAEGELVVEARLIDGGDVDGAVIESTWAQPVVEPTSITIEPCSGENNVNCVYRLPSGAIGVEFTIHGMRDATEVATNASAISPTSQIHCRDRGPYGLYPAVKCLAEFADRRLPIDVEAALVQLSGETLTASATLTVPDYSQTPDWLQY